ncbi:MAG TPA: A/G-specific adenine glycosylase, partial [Elusimicrobiota bacterium]|nr:A/G-specific adenine glycosylase [Elusimicrobiota bacterium]
MAALKAAPFRSRLLAWYKKHGRHDLPWRKGGWDPYRILVSELMLQQTGVQTVVPYFHRFVKRFPTFKALSRAPQEKVLALWSGLGYYARARNLQKAAQTIVAEHGGRLPRTRAAVEDLSGVGPYTAGALLSFAYNQSEALVDGNVIRVLARVYGIRRNTKEPPVLKKIWDLARSLVPPDGARHFNSALMDLG